MNAAVEKEFIDTNILVYAFDQSAGKRQQQAMQLLERLWQSQTGCLSVQVLQEFFVTVTRKVPRPLDTETAEQIVSDLSRWKVVTPTVEDVLEAIQIHTQHQISFWDAMIIQCAGCAGCRVLWSEDLNAGQVYGETKVVNPFIN